MQKFITFI